MAGSAARGAIVARALAKLAAAERPVDMPPLPPRGGLAAAAATAMAKATSAGEPATDASAARRGGEGASSPERPGDGGTGTTAQPQEKVPLSAMLRSCLTAEA
eukprot:3621523-Pleurochrysis_carterae.AAC.1